MAAPPAMRRLQRELAMMEREGNPQIVARPLENNMLEWHFVLHNLPADTVYAGGMYHGKLKFPEQYPHAPPSLIMITPSGRLQVKQRLCLSMTDFHPESWNPAWTMESILVGVISFMIDERDPGSYGALHESAEVRRKLAKESIAFNAADPEFRELFPELIEGSVPAKSQPDTSQCTAASPEPASAPTSPADSVFVGGVTTTASSSSTPSAAAMVIPEEPPPVDPAQLPIIREILPGATGSSSRSMDLAPQRPDGSGTTGRRRSREAGPNVAPASPDAAERAGTASANSGGSGSSSEGEDGPEECWICREDGTHEPLIQPCACRGSMSGVHVSCVEDWIRHHRGSSMTADPPKCSVCGQSYCGTEKKPGIFGFAQHLCSDLLRQALRSAILVGLLVAYWVAAQPEVVPLAFRILLFAVSGSFFAYKTMVLVVSLPRGRLPPTNVLRVLYVSDLRILAVHIAEAVAIVVIVGLWCAYGQLRYQYFLPVCLVVLVPLGAILLQQPSSPFSLRTLQLILLVIGSPVLVMIHLARVIYTDPARLADPCDGVIHVMVPIVIIALCWFGNSNVPVLLIWACHAVVLIVALIELHIIKRMSWKDGRIWWVFMQLSMLAAYVANLLHNFSEGWAKEHSLLIVLCASMAWLGLASSVALSVNWEICVRQYRTWQHRNGSFHLNTPAVAPTTIGAQAIPNTSVAPTVVPQDPIDPAAPRLAPVELANAQRAVAVAHTRRGINPEEV